MFNHNTKTRDMLSSIEGIVNSYLETYPNHIKGWFFTSCHCDQKHAKSILNSNYIKNKWKNNHNNSIAEKAKIASQVNKYLNQMTDQGLIEQLSQTLISALDGNPALSIFSGNDLNSVINQALQEKGEPNSIELTDLKS